MRFFLLGLLLLLGVTSSVVVAIEEDTDTSEASNGSDGSTGPSSTTEEKEDDPSEEEQRARIGEQCSRWGLKLGGKPRCQIGLECKFDYCYNKACLQRESKALAEEFDPIAYRDSLLDEAGITKNDLLVARQKYNDTGFLHSSAANAFVKVIYHHKDELEKMATVLQFCASDESLQPYDERRRRLGEADNNEESNIGADVGSYFGEELGFHHPVGEEDNAEAADQEERELQIFRPKPSSSPTISNAPSVSKQPSTSPSVSNRPTMTPSSRPTRDFSSPPTFTLTPKTYVGFHLEGGFLVDGSYSYMYPSDTMTDCATSPDAYQRSCFGFSGGFGFEVSLITFFMTNRVNEALLGESTLFDYDGALGLAIGNGFGRYFSGSSTQDDPCYFEFTVGGGFGIEVFGSSVCETTRPIQG